MITSLTEKKKHFETNQAEKTAENKKCAQDKIAALKARVAAGEDVNTVLETAEQE